MACDIWLYRTDNSPSNEDDYDKYVYVFCKTHDVLAGKASVEELIVYELQLLEIIEKHKEKYAEGE